MLGNVWGLIQAVNVRHPSAAGAASHKYPASADFVVVSDECWLSVEFVVASPCSRMIAKVWGLIQAANVRHPSAAGAASHKYPPSAGFVMASHKYPASADLVVVSDKCWLSADFVGASPCSRRLAGVSACYQAARDD
jgi:hypothetical protein